MFSKPMFGIDFIEINFVLRLVFGKYRQDTGSTNTPSNFGPVVSTFTRSPAAKQCEGSEWGRFRKGDKKGGD